MILPNHPLEAQLREPESDDEVLTLVPRLVEDRKRALALLHFNLGEGNAFPSRQVKGELEIVLAFVAVDLGQLDFF